MPFRVFSPIHEAGPIVRKTIPLDRRPKYLALCRLYRSQRQTFLGLFPFMLAHYALKGVHQYQELDASVICARPHAGALLYERRGWLRWESFESEVEAFRSRYLA
jgi:hypothetical protein